ncbi:MAG: SpoIIE family protein phosphatase [Candidatus Omnitrophica bacterium]|nr:SpoIIE family protein phosphatase [Candidatus Omnitrophota bacterium]
MAKVMRKSQKICIRILSLGFFILIFSSLLGWHDSIELKIYDFFLKFRPKGNSSNSLIILEVEEEVREDGLWPWKKEWLPYLVNYLSGLGVKAILVDSSLKKYIDFEHPFLKSPPTKTQIFYPQENSLDFEDRDLILDQDGKIRRYRLFLEGKKSLVLQTYLSYMEEDLSFPFHKEFLINYDKNKYSGVERYTYFNLVISIFLSSRQESPKIDFSRFKDKICIIGMAPVVVNKSYPTPFNLTSPLEIRLQVLDSLLRSKFLHRANRWGNTGILLLLSLLSTVVFLKVRRSRRFLFVFLFILSYLAISFIVFYLLGFWMDNFLPAFSSFYIFLAITIYRYSAEIMLKKEEKKKELAWKLKQETFINNNLVTKDVEIVIKTSFSHEAEGDFFDIIKLEDNQIGVLLGRASGKGLETVNYITKLVNEFRLQAPLCKRPRILFNAVNNILFAEGTKGMYATCLYLLVDMEKRILSFANAGHEPLIMASEGKQEINLYEALDSTPLGIAKNVGFFDQEVGLNKGDLVVGFTAGVVEIRNREGKEFGINNLKDIINQYRTWNVAKLGNKVFEKIHRFSQSQGAHSEFSLLLLKVKEEVVKEKETVHERRKTLVQQMVK